MAKLNFEIKIDNEKLQEIVDKVLSDNDIVKVVRCKKCKFYDRDQCYHERHEHHAQSIYQRETDFCSYGESIDENI